MADSDQEQDPRKPSEQRGETMLDELRARREGRVPESRRTRG